MGQDGKVEQYFRRKTSNPSPHQQKLSLQCQYPYNTVVWQNSGSPSWYCSTEYLLHFFDLSKDSAQGHTLILQYCSSLKSMNWARLLY